MIEHRVSGASTPLRGQRVLVTRARDQAAEMSRQLRALGAEPVELPTIEFERNPFPDQTRRAISELQTYDWVVFTSTNGVDVFLELLREAGGDGRDFGSSRIVAVGAATAERLSAHGLEPSLIPDEFHGGAVLETMLQQDVSGTRVLIPRAEVAREILPDGLRAAGAVVDVLPVYRTVRARPDATVLRLLAEGEIDIVTFASSSAVTNIIEMLDGSIESLVSARIACIGDPTAETVRQHGLEPWVIAGQHTIPGLIGAICSALEEVG